MKLLFAKENDRSLSAADGATVYITSIVIALLIQVLSAILLIFFPIANEAQEMTVNLVLMCILQFGNLAAVLIVTHNKKLALPYAIRPIKWYGYIISIVAAFTCIFCFVLVGNWFAILLENIGYKFVDDLNFTTPLQVILGVISTVILAPICEEMVYRGALLGGLTKKMGVLPALIVSALCFSLMHMNPEQTVYQFCFGIVAGYLAISTRSILPSIIFHSTNNLVAFAISFIPTSGGDTELDIVPTIIATIVLAAVGIVVICLLGKAMAQDKNRLNLVEEKQVAIIDEQEIEENKRSSPVMGKNTCTILIALGLGVCALTWLLVFLNNILPIV